MAKHAELHVFTASNEVIYRWDGGIAETNVDLIDEAIKCRDRFVHLLPNTPEYDAISINLDHVEAIIYTKGDEE